MNNKIDLQPVPNPYTKEDPKNMSSADRIKHFFDIKTKPLTRKEAIGRRAAALIISAGILAGGAKVVGDYREDLRTEDQVNTIFDNPNAKTVEYEVKPGDSLTSVANVVAEDPDMPNNPGAIRDQLVGQVIDNQRENNQPINSDNIRVGDTLEVPAQAADSLGIDVNKDQTG